MRIGSLFSGIGGLDLGLEWAGLGPVVWQVEQDEYCRRILEQHWPGVPRYRDVRDVGADELATADIICGGFPCQGNSSANPRGRGLRDPRSALWREFRRIVDEIGPTWVVVENSGGNASRWVDHVVADLAQLGFSALPVPLEARLVGAPHRRSRVFVVAHAHGYAVRHDEQREPTGRPPRIRDAGHAQPVDHGAHAGWPSGVEVVSPVHGVPRPMVRALGNAVVPQCAQVVGELIQMLEEDVG